MEINKSFLENIVEFEYFDVLGNSSDGVRFQKDTEDYYIDIIFDSNGEFRCEVWNADEQIQLDDETLSWLVDYAEESLEEFHDEMMDEQMRREIAFDYFMSANFEKY